MSTYSNNEQEQRIEALLEVQGWGRLAAGVSAMGNANDGRREFDEVGSRHLETQLIAENLEGEGAL
jgi:hypothetical protein